MQTDSSRILISWISCQTTFVSLWDRMEGAWLRTLGMLDVQQVAQCTLHKAAHREEVNLAPRSYVMMLNLLLAHL
jgi:hypothetical protein